MNETSVPDALFPVDLTLVNSEGKGTTYNFIANEEHCSALAKRFGCVEISAFRVEATVTALRDEGQYRLKGRVQAHVVQSCVITLDPVPADLDLHLDLLLLPEDAEDVPEGEIEEDDFETYSDNEIDLGELAAIELALALDPYPRAPEVSLADIGPGGGDKGFEVLEEGYVSRNRPFEALAALKRKG